MSLIYVRYYTPEKTKGREASYRYTGKCKSAVRKFFEKNPKGWLFCNGHAVHSWFQFEDEYLMIFGDTE